jgi:hypothetical protein
MEKKEKIRLITDLVAEHRSLDKINSEVYSVFGAGDGKLLKFLWRVFDKWVASVAATVGDTQEWISWYIFDNDCGKRGFEAGYDGKMVKITSVKKLVELIEKP